MGWASNSDTGHTTMKPFIRITRHPYEEPYVVNLVVAASNGRQHGQLEIYANADDLGVIANRLRGFPREPNDTLLWELGSERPEDRFAFYFCLHVFRLAANGSCAVGLRFNNNQPPPAREISEFSLEAWPADLDRLAGLLEQFAQLKHRVLEWDVTDGALFLDA
jgi:hypothetical protein